MNDLTTAPHLPITIIKIENSISQEIKLPSFNQHGKARILNNHHHGRMEMEFPENKQHPTPSLLFHKKYVLGANSVHLKCRIK